MDNNNVQAINSQTIKADTLSWVERVVIGLNLCPFAKPVVTSGEMQLVVEESSDMATVLDALAKQFEDVNRGSEHATVLFVVPNGFDRFETYLDLVDYGNDLLADLDYEGVLQMATFHPDYQFEDSDFDDAANFTNRSPYPMLHLLQESAVEKAVDKHPNTESIPQRNIDLFRAMSREEIAVLKRGAD